MSIAAEQQRYFLTVLVWALLLEIFVVWYYMSKGDFGFMLQMTAILMVITVLGIYAVIHKIRKEIKEGYM